MKPNLRMSSNLRVHISPIGYEFRRATEPLIKMQADKVYLITYRQDDDAAKFFAQVKKELAQNYKHIRVEEVFIDIWNLYECIEKFREIILKEKGNHIYVNVSTGTKITAIAGMLAAMLWKAIPYYAPVSYPPSKEIKIPSTEHVEVPDLLPVYDMIKPDKEIMLVLSLLKSHGGIMKKSHLIEKLEESGEIKIRDEKIIKLTPAAKHSQLRAILDPMEKEWHFIKIESSGRRSEIIITEQGETALKIFGVSNT